MAGRGQLRRRLSDGPTDTCPFGYRRFHVEHDGLWFDLDVRWLAPQTRSNTPFDLAWRSRRCIVVGKHALNTRALRAAGLTNDA